MNLLAAAAALLLAATAVAGLPAAVAPDLTGGIVNIAPTVLSASLSTGSLTPTAGGASTLVTTAVVTDANGYSDVASVQVTILKPDGTTHLAAAAATFVSGSGIQATYTRTSGMNYYDSPATGASSYKVKVTVTDSQGATATNLAALAAFNFGQVAAANTPSSVTLGSNLQPGDTTPIGAMQVSNYGNIQIDTQVSGTNLASAAPVAATLPVASISYSLASDMGGSAPLSTGATALPTFDLATGAGSAKNIYWALTVPSGASQYVPAGTYTSTVTVTAIAG